MVKYHFPNKSSKSQPLLGQDARCRDYRKQENQNNFLRYLNQVYHLRLSHRDRALIYSVVNSPWIRNPYSVPVFTPVTAKCHMFSVRTIGSSWFCSSKGKLPYAYCRSGKQGEVVIYVVFDHLWYPIGIGLPLLWILNIFLSLLWGKWHLPKTSGGYQGECNSPLQLSIRIISPSISNKLLLPEWTRNRIFSSVAFDFSLATQPKLPTFEPS